MEIKILLGYGAIVYFTGFFLLLIVELIYSAARFAECRRVGFDDGWMKREIRALFVSAASSWVGLGIVLLELTGVINRFEYMMYKEGEKDEH